jgi:uncharacterized Rmd1/YagE family protein
LQVKLAISHALAQSTLLGCYEERLQVSDCIHTTPTAAAAAAAAAGASVCLF